MRNRLRYVFVAATLLTLGVPAAGAPAAQSAGDTFTWFGELVSVDSAARTMTVKSRVAYHEALSQLKQFKAGDRVWVVWSGLNDYSDAVREFRRPGADGKVTETLVMPAELVTPEATNQLVTLRVTVPETSLAAIRNLKSGEWVTVTSRQRPAPESDAVVGVRAYTQSATTTTTN